MGEDEISPLGNVQTYDGGQGERDMQVSPPPAVVCLGAENKHNVQHSVTSCYTCRRRRVPCDKVLPTCWKCYLAGKECLGYKKPLTWVKGVASRGKMMGLTFDDVAPKKKKGVLARQPHRPSWSLPDPLDEAQNHDNQDMPSGISHRYVDQSGSQDQLFIRPALVDPLLQGLDRVERYYLSYCM